MYAGYWFTALFTWAYLQIETDTVARSEFFSLVVVMLVLSTVWAFIASWFSRR